MVDHGMQTDQCEAQIYRHFVDYRFVDLQFVYKLNTKTLYSWLTKPKTLKLNAKTSDLQTFRRLSIRRLAIRLQTKH